MVFHLVDNPQNQIKRNTIKVGSHKHFHFD